MIGIIGGNGVAATVKLQNIIENKYTYNGAFRDCYHPELLIWQATQAPSRSMFLEGKGDSFLPDYISIGKKMKACGVNKLCMCCNTAHFAVDELEKAIGLPFINIIDEVVKKTKEKGYKKIGILASDGNVEHRLYDKSFSKIYPEAVIVYPSKDFQTKVTEGICGVKNLNRFLDVHDPKKPQNLFVEIIQHLADKGCNAVVLACTDISVDFNFSLHYPTAVLDSLEILANCIIKEYESE